MIDESIITELKSRQGVYDFDSLITYMENSGFTFKNKRLAGPAGITTFDEIILDLRELCMKGDKFMFFVILHEMCHMKRNAIFSNLDELINHYDIEDFDEFHNYFIKEEILADRFASILFFKLNKFPLPEQITQQLNLPSKQEEYKRVTRMFHGQIKNKESYYDFLEKIVIN